MWGLFRFSSAQPASEAVWFLLPVPSGGAAAELCSGAQTTDLGRVGPSGIRLSPFLRPALCQALKWVFERGSHACGSVCRVGGKPRGLGVQLSELRKIQL